jgi:hypothetical protein
VSEERLEAMEPRLAELLRSNAPKIEAPEGALGRVAGRLALSLPIVPGPGGGGGSSPPPAVAPPAAASMHTGFWGAKAVGSIAVALAVGGGAGAAVMHAVTEPKERIVYVDRPAPVSSSVPPAESVPRSVPVEDLPQAASAPPLSTPSASPRANAPPTASAPPLADEVEIERRLLDDARAALVQGDATACLVILDRDLAQHPEGKLSEEREALAVRTLFILGRRDEARERANRFVSRYPSSLMRPAVEAAIGEAGAPQ